MKKCFKLLIVAAVVAISGVQTANADGLKNLLGKLGKDTNVGDIVNNVLGSSKVELSALEGNWTTTGPALVFKSDDLLEKAGGAAASAAVEKKLDTYYKRLGLENIPVTFNKAGTMTMKIKGYTVSGTLTDNGDGSYKLQLGKSGKLAKLGSLTSMTVYLQKAGNNLSITADATKLVDLATKLASVTDKATLKTAANLLKSYDQICIGFRLAK